MRGSTSVGYDQFETSAEAIEQELRPAFHQKLNAEGLHDYGYKWSLVISGASHAAIYSVFHLELSGQIPKRTESRQTMTLKKSTSVDK